MSKINILGVGVDPYRKDGLLKSLSCSLDSGDKVFIITANPETILLTLNDTDYKEALEKADIITPDGIGLLWASKYLNSKSPSNFLRFFWLPLLAVITLFHLAIHKKSYCKFLPERIAGSDLFWDLAKMAADRGKSIYLLGAQEGVAQKVGLVLKHRFPEVKIAGFYHGDPYEKELEEKINKAGADFLFVAWNQPKQEKWINDNLSRLDIELAIGLGGTFNFVAQEVPRAPRFFQKIGFEWLWRLMVQPKRFFRTFASVFKFVYAVVKYKIKNPKFNYGN